MTTPAPFTNPVTAPITNPATTPTAVPGTSPVTNPATYPYPPQGGGVGVPTTPVFPAPATTVPIGATPIFPAPATTVPTGAAPTTMTGAGTWCVPKTGVMEAALQAGMDYACGMGGADCSALQPMGSCYNPNTMQAHASYAFNSYFQRNTSPTSCDFGGAGMLVDTNPSSGACMYQTSSG
ncbi:glucan endo-1,3-beta-glucosidase 13-like [Lolium perenne]|uniref:glucan endo-1,3-beta-glucosidase 13-like n=1 Tax=Lolium perenne TaxID=4522 RepID=UPI003A99C144